MTEVILAILYFFRPISYITVAKTFGGYSVLELFAIVSFLVLVVIWLLSFSTKRKFQHTSIGFFISAYVLWVLMAFIAYFDRSNIANVGKLILPLLTYIFVRNAIKNKENYIRLLWIMIVGFSVPTIISAILIAQYKGIYVQDYWTKLYRFTGVYPNPHDLGHNMTFLLMIIVIYLTLNFFDEKEKQKLPIWRKVFILILIITAIFCLYKSYVRTALLGLVVFGFIYLFFYSKKLLVTAGVLLIAGVIIFWSVWGLIFHDVVEVAEGSRPTERIASGRPYIWKHNYEEFKKLTIDRKLAGVGPGNRNYDITKKAKWDNFWDSHNDYLEVVVQSGIIGFIIFSIIQILIFKTILSIPGRERFVYIALFAAITFMNFGSNSYVSRFGLGQSFYLVVLYAEVVRPIRT